MWAHDHARWLHRGWRQCAIRVWWVPRRRKAFESSKIMSFDGILSLLSCSFEKRIKSHLRKSSQAIKVFAVGFQSYLIQSWPTTLPIMILSIVDQMCPHKLRINMLENVSKKEILLALETLRCCSWAKKWIYFSRLLFCSCINTPTPDDIKIFVLIYWLSKLNKIEPEF